MAFVPKNLTGAIFKRKKPKTKDTDSDYNGSVVVNGQEYWLDGYIKEPKAGGEKYISLSLKPKAAQSNVPHGTNPSPTAKRHHDLSKQRHMPPPPPSKSTEPQLDPVDPQTGEYRF